MKREDTIAIEDRYAVPFFKKIPVSIERGEGVWVWDEEGRRYLDFTSGWGVTCLGHAHPVIVEALERQGRKIIQNPSSGLTYSPPRARLLALMQEILPGGLTRIFFSNSGAEANDAAIKLARKVTGRRFVVSSEKSFHGRTISTASATGQARHREKFNPLMPDYLFVPFDDLPALEKVMSEEVAAVILEPIQGEGGVNVPAPGYLEGVSELCRRHGACLIIDEIQTGFGRTGSMFAIDGAGIEVDFLTMAKGIAGGFPFGAFAMTERIAQKIEIGDHGGTYCGNPLGCAVAHAVVWHLIDEEVPRRAAVTGERILGILRQWCDRFPSALAGVRGKGLLIALEFAEEEKAAGVYQEALEQGLFLNLTQGRILRLFPALTITDEEVDQGLEILLAAIEKVLG